MQPHALEGEGAVLGALMIDTDAFSVGSELLRPETFYDPRHQKIYAAIQSLSIDEKPVDIMTVVEQLKHMGTLDEIGGQMYVVEISSKVATSAHVDYHARVLVDKYLARQLITFASNVQTKAFDDTMDNNDLMQETEAELFKISQKNLRQDYVQIAPVIAQAKDILVKAASNMGELTGLPTGYTKLDEFTAGWQRSDLIIIAGRPAMGKTSFALSLAKNAAVDYNKPVAFFSLEMNNVQLVNRLISNVCEISGKKILNGQLDGDEWARFDKYVGRLSASPIYIDDTPALSIFELRTKARRLVREKGVALIMIDYLQLMNASGMRLGSRQEEVSNISRSLKGLAKELDIPIIALSQLNRSVENREGAGADGKRPQLSDLRESGAIEQDADMVIFVHRPEYYRILEDEKGNDLSGKAQIIIAKHRKGGTGDVLLDFKGEFTRFDNPNTGGSYGGEVLGSKINGDLPPFDAPGPFNPFSDLANPSDEPAPF